MLPWNKLQSCVVEVLPAEQIYHKINISQRIIILSEIVGYNLHADFNRPGRRL